MTDMLLSSSHPFVDTLTQVSVSNATPVPVPLWTDPQQFLAYPTVYDESFSFLLTGGGTPTLSSGPVPESFVSMMESAISLTQSGMSPFDGAGPLSLGVSGGVIALQSEGSQGEDCAPPFGDALGVVLAEPSTSSAASSHSTAVHSTPGISTPATTITFEAPTSKSRVEFPSRSTFDFCVTSTTSASTAPSSSLSPAASPFQFPSSSTPPASSSTSSPMSSTILFPSFELSPSKRSVELVGDNDLHRAGSAKKPRVVIPDTDELSTVNPKDLQGSSGSSSSSPPSPPPRSPSPSRTHRPTVPSPLSSVPSHAPSELSSRPRRRSRGHGGQIGLLKFALDPWLRLSRNLGPNSPPPSHGTPAGGCRPNGFNPATWPSAGNLRELRNADPFAACAAALDLGVIGGIGAPGSSLTLQPTWNLVDA